MTDESSFYLGRRGDDSELRYDPADLTTHGVIVGMTGSGKTGLGMILLEEALLAGIPTLVIDPKGDMGNLALTFPNLATADFAPWTDKPEETAALWREGLAGSGIGPERIATLRAKVGITVYTPGSSAGVPLNVIGSLDAPAGTVDADTLREEIEATVSGLLGLVGVESDPMSGREHILLSNLLHAAWSAGSSLDLATLIGQVQQPPMRKLGVIDVDTFFPASDRNGLAMALNGLAASPAFAAWAQGPPLDISSLLWDETGTPQAAIVSVAHLTDDERQFVVALVLSRLITWMRGQSGSTDLRVLGYIDEVFGYAPPTANPPAKKPILTLMKQARAFGVGLVLSTQNPVDLDYKAISNAGTWMIGRLQTERDQARLLDGMTSADTSAADLGETIAGLEKRQFVLHSTREDQPDLFSTRWAMSYLAGPLTRDQIALLNPDRTVEVATAEPAQATTPSPKDNETTVEPKVADGITVRYLDPAAPWNERASGSPLRPGIAARVSLLFDETKADLRHEAEWEAVLFPLADEFEAEDFVEIDYDDRDLRPEPPAEAVYELTELPIHTKRFFQSAQTRLRDHLYRGETVELFHNTPLKLYSRPGESAEEFAQRCDAGAEQRLDEAADAIREKLATKSDRIEAAISKAEDRVREVKSDVSSQDQSQLLDVAGDVLGGLLGGRKSTRSILGSTRRASSKRRQRDKAAERLRTAENRLQEKLDDLEELEEELRDTLEDLDEVWTERAADIETIEVGLEKTDIEIDDLTLFWG